MGGDSDVEIFELAFGLPWNYDTFIAKAVSTGHPANFCKTLPADILQSVECHAQHSLEQLVDIRLNWCKHWLKQAALMDKEEKSAAASRPVASRNKRLKLTRSILESIQYEDMGVLDILEVGSPLAGEIPGSSVFQPAYKTCVTTLAQLEANAAKRNQLVLGMCKSSGDGALDRKVVEETEEELRLGWADGPWELDSLESGATISRRFALQQGTKCRMIDDYSVSGVNDSCTIHNKLDLHAVDSFIATSKRFFEVMREQGRPTDLTAKTYDLKSAYRQIPVREDHLKYAYFCIYHPEEGRVLIYRSLTLPFGATHSVYSFLRLARMLHALATRCLKLITTNFYDDFILASPPSVVASAAKSMELLFLLTGWEFATSGKKATEFSEQCAALGGLFDLRQSGQQILEICNTESRVQDLVQSLDEVIHSKVLTRTDALKLRGRLGFADGFLHGRLGSLVLKRLIEHAYGNTKQVGGDLAQILQFMKQRLLQAGPKKLSMDGIKEWILFTDASFDKGCTGGLGAVLLDCSGTCVAWYGLQLDQADCQTFGADLKETIIYELELLAVCLALELWQDVMQSSYPVVYIDNDSVRYAMIRGVAAGRVAELMIERSLRTEVIANTCAWFARVPTEANISDLPSRQQEHPLLEASLDQSPQAHVLLNEFSEMIRLERLGDRNGEAGTKPSHLPRKRARSFLMDPPQQIHSR